FRQADIYTYLKAKSLVNEENQLSLDTNFRSHPPLVHALNRLFESASSWMELPRLNSSLEYMAVKASSKREEHAFTDGFESVHFFIADDHSNKKLKIKELEERLYFPFICNQIKSLKKQGFSLSEMAILVKDHFQAERIMHFLKEKKVAAFLQRVSSLSSSCQVLRLQELLEAVISPKDESVLKTALGGSFIGFSHEEILELNDPFKMEEVLSRFFHFRHLLYHFGFLSFFEAFLKSSWKGLSVAEELLSKENGENSYLTLLQIGEIVAQEEVKGRFPPEKLLQFLKSFDALDFDGDSRMKKWRGEEKEAVQILTIHSSKGLEFDIVFALGLVNENPLEDVLIPAVQGEKMVLIPFDKKLDACVYNLELNAEKMRQLYVAMTRSRYRLYVPAAFSSKEKRQELAVASCMELFLGKLNCQTSKELMTKLEELKISYSSLEESVENFDLEESFQEEIILVKPEKVNISFDPIYTVSFTQLAKKTAAETSKGSPKDFDAAEKTSHTLPSSAKLGILLHSILEALFLKKYAPILAKEELNSFIEPFIFGGSFWGWRDVIAEMVFRVLQIKFDTFEFKDIAMSKTYSEKEFLYFYENGLMKGVVDFMFMHQDKYYFIDWKSNWLGNSSSDYSREAMQKEMEKNDYFLQADIYSQAIQRFLKAADDRDFEECFGGAYYIFLRGLNAENQNGVYRLG
ncbi:MAG TPA: 3'-5' exonuclease, partial [Parachlamydiaceae bacterium]|nr:3'-5' exonuclease [Parachlamydiaceae bacterium]